MEKSIKRNKIFSFSLMKQGISQTTMLGICVVFLTLLFSCGTPILGSINQSNVYRVNITLFEFAMPIFCLWIFIPILLVLSLFSFMNKRNASDFYHSIPFSRTCVYISYSAAVVFWGLTAIISSSIASYIFYKFIPVSTNYIPFEFVKSTILVSVVAMLLSMSVTLLAKTLSGTDFANIVITLLIMFTPRFLLMLFSQAVIGSTIIATNTVIPFVNPKLNVLLIPLINTSYTTLYAFDKSITDPYSLIYSLILAVVYYAAALLLCNIRKSETAGKTSAYRGVQIVVRCIIGFLPIIPLCVQCVEYGIFYVDNRIWYETISCSVILYFFYELFTTKSFKRLLKAIPAYLIVVAAGAVFLCSGTMCRNAILNDIPAVSDIESVSIISEPLSDSLNLQEAQKYKFTDKELIKILQSSLAENINYIETHDISYKYDIYLEYDDNYTVVFHTNSGRDIERTIYVDKKTQKQILNYVFENEEYISAIMSLPSESEICTIDIYNYPDVVSQIYIDEKTEVIWESYKKEYNALTPQEKINVRQGNYVPTDLVARFELITYDNGIVHYNYLSVVKSYFPQTSAFIMNEL